MKEKINRTDREQLPSLAIGVGFNQKKIIAVLLDDRGRILAEQSEDNPQRTTRAAAGAVSRLILGVASSGDRGRTAINSIGVSVDGIVDPPTGRVTIPSAKGWTRVALKQMVEESLAESGHDIRMPATEKRARAQQSASSHPSIRIYAQPGCIAAAEGWIGAVRGKDSVVYLSISDEIESGLFIDGRIVQGASGRAGAAGWMALSETLKHGYESRGCFATESASNSLKRRAIEEWSGYSHSLLGKLIKSDPGNLDATMIIRAARGGDSLAINVVHETCRWIGRGIANFISTLNPDAIVIGGDVGLKLKPFIEEIRKEAGLWASPEAFKECRIAAATLGENAPAVGAGKQSPPQ